MENAALVPSWLRRRKVILFIAMGLLAIATVGSCLVTGQGQYVISEGAENVIELNPGRTHIWEPRFFRNPADPMQYFVKDGADYGSQPPQSLPVFTITLTTKSIQAANAQVTTNAPLVKRKRDAHLSDLDVKYPQIHPSGHRLLFFIPSPNQSMCAVVSFSGIHISRPRYVLSSNWSGGGSSRWELVDSWTGITYVEVFRVSDGALLARIKRGCTNWTKMEMWGKFWWSDDSKVFVRDGSLNDADSTFVFAPFNKGQK